MRGTSSFAIVLTLALLSSACSGFSKIDYTSLSTRAAWQRPDLVIDALDIQPGDHVVDLGSGEGYFLSYLVEAVGPDGRVTAVDVEEEVTDALQARVDEAGWKNVQVVLGAFGDPKLADGEAHLVLLVNTYHHIEDRREYFAKLHSALRPEGRVALIDPDVELTGLLSLTLDEGHQSAIDDVRAEMATAGYQEIDRFDFLPVQIFAVYAALSTED
jgi:cyclopropane fatty-acyl-phospholipid synthase-like methyltransferase